VIAKRVSEVRCPPSSARREKSKKLDAKLIEVEKEKILDFGPTRR
jgi:hypothetical protein